MCGIVGAVANRDVTPTLLDGLKRLEYRGYDSAGLAVVDSSNELDLRRSVGRVVNLENICDGVFWHYWCGAYTLGYSWSTSRK